MDYARTVPLPVEAAHPVARKPAAAPTGRAAPMGGGSPQAFVQLSAPHDCPTATQTSPLPDKEGSKLLIP